MTITTNISGDLQSVEAPSGKGAKDENFPVGSFLLPKSLRPHVAIYYNYARAIDDIADDPVLPSAEKVLRLEAFASALRGEPGFGSEYEKAHILRKSMEEMKLPFSHGTDLVAAFVQDCKKFRYQSWQELLDYCSKSANPVGRYLLDLHGEDRAGYFYSDALCTVLQIINHLQDCQDDKVALNRVYIIEPWLAEEGGTVDDIDGKLSSIALRRVMDRMLNGCEVLMHDARKLPSFLKSRRLAMESAIIVRLADKLIELLKHGDPIADRIDLKKIHFVSAGLRGVVSGFFVAGSRASND